MTTVGRDLLPVVVGPAVVAAVVSAAVSFAMLWFTARREDRRHRRELFAEAYAAYSAYREFPYVVRRRRHDQPEGERQRISGELRAVQERLSFFLAWTRVEDPEVGDAFATLVGQLRSVAGVAISDAWRMPAIIDDEEMNIGDIDLSGLAEAESTYLDALGRRVRPLHKRFRAWILTRRDDSRR
jgi:hypothetical protein